MIIKVENIFRWWPSMAQKGRYINRKIVPFRENILKRFYSVNINFYIVNTWVKSVIPSIILTVFTTL